MTVGYLGLGSNVGTGGPTWRPLCAALAAPRSGVAGLPRRVYETEPVGLVLDQPDFLNACVRIETGLEPEALLDACKAVEREVGRAAGGVRHGPRVIDVDLLLLGRLTYHSERLRSLTRRSARGGSCSCPCWRSTRSCGCPAVSRWPPPSRPAAPVRRSRRRAAHCCNCAMLLVVDVGNTQTHFGVYPRREHEIAEHWRFATVRESTQDELGAALSNLLALRGLGFADIDASIVSSTVPQLSEQWTPMAARYLGHEMLVVGPAIRTGMPIRIDNPREVGADRLVNAVAAYERVRAPAWWSTSAPRSPTTPCPPPASTSAGSSRRGRRSRSRRCTSGRPSCPRSSWPSPAR